MPLPLSIAVVGKPLDRDAPCVGCAYNLRGLAPEGECPECGKSIADSLTPTTLAFADPAWVRGLYHGSLNLFCGTVLALIPLPFVGAASRSLFFVWLAALPGGLVLTHGGIQLTAREPRAVPVDSDMAREPRAVPVDSDLARAIARGCVVATTLSYFAGGVAALVDVAWWVGMMCLPIAASLIVGGFAALTHGQRIALRIPNQSLANQMGWIRGLCMIACVIPLVSTAMALLVDRMAFVGMLFILPMLFVAGLLTLAVFVQLRLALGEVVEFREDVNAGLISPMRPG